MTETEWKQLGVPMTWCICQDEDGEPGGELNLATTAPDGQYEVETAGWYVDEVFGTVHMLVRIVGIEVQDGQFVAEPTARACYAAAALARGWSSESIEARAARVTHPYIERLEYDRRRNRFLLHTGS